jgi:light-harvesting complex 1 alpha chain
MHRIWQLFPPQRSLVALFGFLTFLALLIHFVVLVSPDFNWIDGDSVRIEAPASNMTAMPPVRTIN